MDADLAVDLFWISVTINLSAALLFACRGVASWVTGRFTAEEPAGSWRRELYILQDEKPFILPRFLVISIQSAVLCVAGILLLFQGEVIRQPYYDLNTVGRTCFAINIGCYIYLIVQDAILQRYLANYYITFMHHTVTTVVYIVFLEYRENALSGTVGLLFAGATPFFELSYLMEEVQVEAHRTAYGVSHALSGCSALVFRLFLPIACFVYSFVVSSPFAMDILVLACYFLSIVFFGMLNMWLVYSAGSSFRDHLRKKSAWIYMKPLQTGKPHGLDVRFSRRQHNGTLHQARLTAKRNDLSFLAPCSNTNLVSAKNTSNPTNSSTKDYYKVNISAFLNNFGSGTDRNSDCLSVITMMTTDSELTSSSGPNEQNLSQVPSQDAGDAIARRINSPQLETTQMVKQQVVVSLSNEVKVVPQQPGGVQVSAGQLEGVMVVDGGTSQ